MTVSAKTKAELLNFIPHRHCICRSQELLMELGNVCSNFPVVRTKSAYFMFISLNILLVFISPQMQIRHCLHFVLLMTICTNITKLQASVFDILPQTTAIIDCAVGLRKLKGQLTVFC